MSEFDIEIREGNRNLVLDEFQKRIIKGRDSLSKKQLDKKEEKYQNAVGVDLYNLNPTFEESREFYLRYAVGTMFFEEDEKTRVELLRQSRYLQNTVLWTEQDESLVGRPGVEAGIEADLVEIASEHRVFKKITDAIISGELLMEDSVFTIKKNLEPEVSLIREHGTEHWMVSLEIYPKPIVSSILRAAYAWLLRVSSGKVKVQRCSLPGCNNIFIMRPRAKPQKYCSGVHRATAYRKRKKKND